MEGTMAKLAEIFGRNLRALRERTGFTQKKVARLVFPHRPEKSAAIQIGKYERACNFHEKKFNCHWLRLLIAMSQTFTRLEMFASIKRILN
jgi:hypothetical protein